MLSCYTKVLILSCVFMAYSGGFTRSLLKVHFRASRLIAAACGRSQPRVVDRLRLKVHFRESHRSAAMR